MVNNSILKLNELTTNNDEQAIENLEEFVTVFKQITSREDEIRETFHLSGSLKSEIRKVVDTFENKMLNRPNKQGQEEQKIIVQLKNEYETVLEIKSNVFTFFELVEGKLEQIVERYIYADKQLAYYKENFKTRSKFQINLRKFLEVNLDNLQYDKEKSVVYKTRLQPKPLVYENFKYIHLKYIEQFSRKKNYITIVDRDESYEREQLTLANKTLLKQERIAKLIQEYKATLRIHKKLNITHSFYEILQDTNDSDTALQVIHGLVQFVSTDKNYDLNIKKELSEEILNNEILIWKMDIQAK
ncbi:hypothetical protein [Flavivirga eckloniae]|uniref:Uncharacterized protein n=1 Tax=Flavivirga eckloniae TaxID=1803846 RepID=A0A2K9PL86_9FLAO|nr:hypothetical protein [Flavivirga eckloniae]AUP77347.1 hypothetical protein C1H87_00875 [Flavivirga eckloniae]